jgi:hypothetical protein
MIWGWIVLVLNFILGTVFVAVIIDRITMEELDRFNSDLDRRIRDAELERLRQLPTKSRIGRRPDL